MLTINLIEPVTEQVAEWPLIDLTSKRFESGEAAHKFMGHLAMVYWGEGNLRWELVPCAEDTNQVDTLAADIRQDGGKTVVVNFYTSNAAALFDAETFCQYLDWLDVHPYCWVPFPCREISADDIPF